MMATISALLCVVLHFITELWRVHQQKYVKVSSKCLDVRILYGEYGKKVALSSSMIDYFMVYSMGKVIDFSGHVHPESIRVLVKKEQDECYISDNSVGGGRS
jgi:hypothetical protein